MASVVVVEDDPILLELISEAVEAPGHEVFRAACGLEALNRIKTAARPVEFLVTDFSIPGISGIELVRKARLFNPNLKAVLLTGRWIDSIPTDLSNVEYLMKPCSMSQVLAKLNHLWSTGAPPRMF